MEKVIIIGGKGNAVVIAEQIYDAQHRYNKNIEVLGFAFDDPNYKDGINGWPVLCGTKEAYPKFKDDVSIKFVFGMYRNDILKERIALRESLNIPADRWLQFVHPDSYIAKSVKMGYGNIVLSHCSLNTNVIMGNHNFFMIGAHLGHDVKVGDNNEFSTYSCLGSSLQVGNGNFFGIQSTVRNGACIGHNNLIGIGSNLLDSIENDNIIIGNPGKLLRKQQNLYNGNN